MKLFQKLTRVQRKYILIGLIAGGVFSMYAVYLISGLPSLEQLEHPKPELATKVFSIDGEVIDQFYFKNRTPVTMKQLPPKLVEALISTEDIDFLRSLGC